MNSIDNKSNSYSEFIEKYYDAVSGDPQDAEYIFLTELHIDWKETEIHNLFIDSFLDENKDLLLVERVIIGHSFDLSKHPQTPLITRKIRATGWDIGNLGEIVKDTISKEELESLENTERLQFQLSYARAKNNEDECTRIRGLWADAVKNYPQNFMISFSERIDETFPARTQSMVNALKSVDARRKVIIAGEKHLVEEPNQKDARRSLAPLLDYLKDKKFAILKIKAEQSACQIQ